MIATIAILLLAAVVANAGIRPIPKYLWTKQARVLSARSVVGEVRWISRRNPTHQEEEYVSVMSVYAKRLKEINGNRYKRNSFERIVERYSSAIKRHSLHRRPWIMGLNLPGMRPKAWPENMRWRIHKPLWKRAIRVLDEWAAGKRKTLTPDANHYGGDMDADMAENIRKWSRVKAPEYFRNRFYNSWKLTGKPRRERRFGRLIIVQR
jgi:hypothetical protein